MKFFLHILIACCLLAPGLAPAADKPNVVYLLADDLGWSDISGAFAISGCEVATAIAGKSVVSCANPTRFEAQNACTVAEGPLGLSTAPVTIARILVTPGGK